MPQPRSTSEPSPLPPARLNQSARSTKANGEALTKLAKAAEEVGALIMKARLFFFCASFGAPLALMGCGGAAPGYGLPMRWDRPERTLVLGEVARGDTSTPDQRTSSSCKNGGRVGQSLDHLYGFEVRETGSYRFDFVPEFFGVIQVQEKDPEKPWYSGIGCVGAHAGKKAVMSLPLEPGFYWVVVDGNLWDEDGPYTLRVDRDTSDLAVIRPEDAKKVAAIVSSAPSFQVGERAFGTYRSLSGGARPSCGLLGGDGLQKLSIKQPVRVRLRASAQFPFALEVRPSGGGKPTCVRPAEGTYDVELSADLEAGEHVVVIDATRLGPRDRYGGSMQLARVTGAYILDAEVLP
jgi:hypothetical protein